MSRTDTSRDRPAWATRLEGAERTRRIVQCGGCGCSVRFCDMAEHLRDACPGPREDEAA